MSNILNKAIADAIRDVIVSKKKQGITFVSWKDIYLEIQSREFKSVIKNWMVVRNVLQAYILIGQLKRTSDVTVEEYQILG